MTSAAPAAQGNDALPMLAQTADELDRLLQRAQTRTPDLQTIILRDPGAAIELFRLLGHSNPRAASEVKDAAHALSMIGFESYRRHLAKQPRLPLPEGAATARRLPWFQYSQGAHSAHYVRHLGPRDLNGHVDAFSTAALVQNPALLSLWQKAPEAAQGAVDAVASGGAYDEVLATELGEPLAAANARIAAEWSLPALSQRAMSNPPIDGDWQPRQVFLCAELARTSAYDWHGEAYQRLVDQCAEEWQLDPGQLDHQLHLEAVAAARALGDTGYPLSAYQALLIPAPTEQAPPPAVTVADAQTDTTAERETAAAGDKPHPTPQQVLSTLLKDVHRSDGVTRTAFIMLSGDRRWLATRLILGSHDNDRLRGLKLDCGERHLLSLLLTKPQSLWVHAENRAKYTPHLPAPLAQTLGSEGFYAMSLFVGERPIGIMYADGDGLSESGYKLFRSKCQRAMKSLLEADERATR